MSTVEFSMRFRGLERLARRLSLLVLLGGPALWGATGPAHAADSLYDVAKITVDTTAKDAVAARAMGMTEAQMRAMQIMLGRVVPLTVLEQLPEFTKEEVEGLVSGVAIRSEQASTTRYIATLDVNFNPYAVQQFLANYGIPYSEERGPPISILPLMLSAEGVSSEGSVAWRTAWEELDLAHSISPATVLQPRPDLDAATVKAALAGDAEAFATMQSAYGYGGLVIAVGEIKGKKFTTRLAGEDGVGAIDFSRDDAMTGDGKTVARQAAAAALAAIENRWKTTQGGGQLPDEAAYEEGQPPPGMETEGAPAEVPRNVVALVEFSGLKDWQEIRTRLTQIAGLQALEVNALSARTASITFDFAGSLDRLQAALGQNGFALHERDGTFVLRSQ